MIDTYSQFEPTDSVTDHLKAEHFNSHILAGVQIKTTGPNPEIDQIIELCVFVANSRYHPNKKILPLHLYMKPPKDFNTNINKIGVTKLEFDTMHMNAPPAQEQADLFIRWFNEKLNLKTHKKIMPITFNWTVTSAFLRQWLGNINFDHHFSPMARDIMGITAFCNDHADLFNQKIRFPKYEQTDLLRNCRIETDRSDNCIVEAVQMIDLYRKLLYDGIML